MKNEVSSRVYWRCRRGMAELDVFLHGFLKNDYQNLLSGEPLDKLKFTCTHVSNSLIQEVVSYILHKKYVVTTSWGRSFI